LLLDLELLSMDLWTMRSDVTAGATMTAGRLASFVGMLLNRLCKNFVRILTNNYALTFVHTSILGLCNFRLRKHSFGEEVVLEAIEIETVEK
jgi:hypothetical protein